MSGNEAQRSEMAMDRRMALGAMGVAGTAMLASQAWAQDRDSDGLARGGRGALDAAALGWDSASRRYTLPELRYAYDALEPHIDAETMRIHHSKHHQGYVNGLNRALDELAKIRRGEGDKGLIKHWQREMSFHAGGHFNHSLFWLVMAPPDSGMSGRPSLDLLAHIRRDFGSFEAMMEQFKAAAGAVEASGWAWLVFEPNAGQLLITQMEKQQNMFPNGARPLLGVDVWEHAYYLRYQNRRSDYIEAFTKLINWPMVDELFAQAVEG